MQKRSERCCQRQSWVWAQNLFTSEQSGFRGCVPALNLGKKWEKREHQPPGNVCEVKTRFGHYKEWGFGSGGTWSSVGKELEPMDLMRNLNFWANTERKKRFFRRLLKKKKPNENKTMKREMILVSLNPSCCCSTWDFSLQETLSCSQDHTGTASHICIMPAAICGEILVGIRNTAYSIILEQNTTTENSSSITISPLSNWWEKKTQTFIPRTETF